VEGAERSTVEDADMAFHEGEVRRLVAALEQARDTSRLPETPSARPTLHDLLVRARLANV
jgi:hypothetical protein